MDSARENVALFRWRTTFSDSEFPLEVREISQYCPLSMHRHDRFVEIVLVTSGRGIHRIGEECFHIAAGDLLVIPDGWAHTYTSIVDLRYFNILLSPEALKLDWADFNGHPGFKTLFGSVREPNRRYDNYFHMDPAALDAERSLASELHVTLVRREIGYRFRALAQLRTLLVRLCDDCARFKLQEHPEAARRLSALVAEMEKNFAGSYSVDALCRKLRISRTVLFREFKRDYGMAPLEYLMRIRLRKACELLAAGDLALGEIAARCGFCTPSYFAMQFRKHFKLSPRAFRAAGRPAAETACQ